MGTYLLQLSCPCRQLGQGVYLLWQALVVTGALGMRCNQCFFKHWFGGGVLWACGAINAILSCLVQQPMRAMQPMLSYAGWVGQSCAAAGAGGCACMLVSVHPSWRGNNCLVEREGKERIGKALNV
eukprot:1157574-Pelagomonas_calceolata.AAC.20